MVYHIRTIILHQLQVFFFMALGIQMFSKETRLAPNDRPPERSQGTVEGILKNRLFRHILIDSGRNSNLGGETHSRESFTTMPQAPG